MSHSDPSASALPQNEQELLRRAYGLSSDEESRALYRDWARTYDKTMLEGLHYQSPHLVADRLAALMPGRDYPVLEKGGYRDLVCADLNARLPLADGAYQGALCCGTFTTGHVRAHCLDDIMRVLATGAPFAFTVKLEVWESFGFKDKLAQLEKAGLLAIVALEPGCLYADSPEADGMFCSVRRL